MPQQLPKDRPTAADRKREADLVKALEAEDFYGKKKPKTGSYLTKTYKTVKIKQEGKMQSDRPTAADKKREGDLVKALEAEDFYGKKKPVGRVIPKAEADRIKKDVLEKAKQEKVDKMADEYLRKKRMQSLKMESPLMKAAKSAKKQ
jgi:hypothetical protein